MLQRTIPGNLSVHSSALGTVAAPRLRRAPRRPRIDLPLQLISWRLLGIGPELCRLDPVVVVDRLSPGPLVFFSLNGDACRSSLLLVLLGLVLLLFYGGVKVEFLGIVELSRKIRVEAGLVGLVGQLVFAT
jgi:hypothetical protein